MMFKIVLVIVVSVIFAILKVVIGTPDLDYYLGIFLGSVITSITRSDL